MDIWNTYNIILASKIHTIETFDFNELKISSDKIKEYDTGKPYLSYEPSTIKERREFSLEYKGGKPTFRADERLYHLIYPHIFPEEEEDNISILMVKLNERLNFLFKDIMDKYDKVNEAEVDGIEEYDLGLSFAGSCEFDIGKVTCWLNEKYSNLFQVELIAQNVEVEKVVDVKSKYEERFPPSKMVVRDACNEFDGNFDHVMGAEKKFRY